MQITQPTTLKRTKVFLGTAAAAFGLMAGMGMQDASADALLYPAFRTDGSLITLMTWVNKANAPTAPGTPIYPASVADKLHVMYRYSSIAGDPTKASECVHLDGFAKTTLNDLGTVDIGNTINAGKALGSDTTSTGFNIGKGYRGYMTLYNFSGVYPGTAGGENSLSGEGVIADLSTGEAYTYRAANDGLGVTEGNLDDLAYGAFDGGNRVPPPTIPTAVWHPTGSVATSWYVVVTNIDMSFGNPTATVGFADSAGTVGFWYDRNENLISGTLGVPVFCFKYLKLADLMPPASLPFAANGGWAHMQQTAPVVGTADTGILVYKLESTKALKAGVVSSAWTSQNRIDY